MIKQIHNPIQIFDYNLTDTYPSMHIFSNYKSSLSYLYNTNYNLLLLEEISHQSLLETKKRELEMEWNK